MHSDRADIAKDRADIAKDRADVRSDMQDLHRDYAARRAGANNQTDIDKDKADIRADRRDIAKDRADIRSDVHDLHADRHDVRSDRQELRADRQDLRSDHSDMRAVHNAGRPSADRRMTGEQLKTVTAMNQRNSLREVHNVNSTHAATAQPLTAAQLSNQAAENSKKPPGQEATKKPWYHWFWW
jgi:chromosome segregation ATPase